MKEGYRYVTPDLYHDIKELNKKLERVKEAMEKNGEDSFRILYVKHAIAHNKACLEELSKGEHKYKK